MSERNRPGLLISVRNGDEAVTALEAGADLIDVKDPARGSLGIAHHEAVAEVIAAVAGRVPVSAALGEWSPNILTEAHWHLELDLDYVKWGLSGYEPAAAWGEELLETRRELPARLEAVAVAYADWEKANCAPPAEVARFAKRFRYRVLLLDTYQKDAKSTLLDFLKPAELYELIRNVQRGGVQVALGGSLRPEHLKHFGETAPDWFAVRGSACTGGKRDGSIDPVRVRKWKEAIANLGSTATPAVAATSGKSRK